jgi:hypothetical protein
MCYEKTSFWVHKYALVKCLVWTFDITKSRWTAIIFLYFAHLLKQAEAGNCNLLAHRINCGTPIIIQHQHYVQSAKTDAMFCSFAYWSVHCLCNPCGNCAENGLLNCGRKWIIFLITCCCILESNRSLEYLILYTKIHSTRLWWSGRGLLFLQISCTPLTVLIWWWPLLLAKGKD